MRKLAALALGALLLVPLLGTPVAVHAAAFADRPERTLTCDPSRSGGCDVSCVSSAGQSLFVYSAVTAVLVTEFAARHTLLEIQRAGVSEIISVLVGDISHCTLNGLRDPDLRANGGGLLN